LKFLNFFFFLGKKKIFREKFWGLGGQGPP